MINETDPTVIITPLTSPLATKSRCRTEESATETYSSNIDHVIAMVAIAALKPVRACHYRLLSVSMKYNQIHS